METSLDVAILIIHVAEKAIRSRRRTEWMCGYPPEHGGDEFVLGKMREYLDESSVKERLDKLLAQTKKMK